MKQVFFILFFLLSNFIFPQSYKYANYCLDSLISKNFSGRGFQDGGDRKAANFISRELENNGLKSFYKDGYLQNLEIDVNNIINSKLIIGKERIQKKLGTEFLVFGYSPSCTIIIENKKPIYLESKNDLEKIKKEKIKDRVIVFNQKSISYYDIVVFLNNLNTQDIFPKIAIVQGYDKIQYFSGKKVFNFPVIQLKDIVFEKKIKYLELEIESKFEKNYQTQNVLAYSEGKKYKDSIFVFTAHYDHLGKIGDSCYFPGANDNASGVAVLLDLAKYYSKNPSDYTIVFIFTTAEEIGLKGSYYAAENPPFDLKMVKFLFNLDMCGTGSGGLALVNGKKEKRAGEWFEKFNNENRYFKKINIGEESCNSDHCPFVQKGVPALFLFTFGQEYNEYHTVFDNGKDLPFTKHIDLCNILKSFIETYNR
ncbi:MAG: ywaD 1 [Bacteroidetes bacterium]|nr:ywaD 1 [Bacteroidota bacterium]